MYVDIHSHIIPGLDDGAKDLDTFLKMMRIAEEEGITHIIATPHYISETRMSDLSGFIKKSNELQQLASEKGLRVKILSGCEAFICRELADLYDSNHVLTLNQSNYILVELPSFNLPVYTEQVFYELQLRGLTPILAHPERNSHIMNDPDFLLRLTERGILVQVNAGSITGLYGKHVRNAAINFIGKGYVHFVASDAHTDRRRAPRLKEAAGIVKERFGYEVADALFYLNGKTVIENGNDIISFNEGFQNRRIPNLFLGLLHIFH